MAVDTITLMLEGDVPLDVFADAMKSFSSLVFALTTEEGGNIEWTIDDLQPGSAVATIRGRSPEPEKVERVVRHYARVGKAVRNNEPLRSPRISRPARALGHLVGKRVRSVRFETPEEEAIINTPPSRLKRGVSTDEITDIAKPLVDEDLSIGAFGAVEGEVQTLTKRHGLRFTLYDSLGDRAVSCYLQLGQEEQMRNIWGRRAIVEGFITRDPVSGRPLSVRRIVNVIPIAEEGDYTQARGILPLDDNDELPEVRIRQTRDE